MRLMEFVSIVVAVFLPTSTLYGREILTVKNFLIANGIVKKLEDYKAEGPKICRADSSCYPGHCLLMNGLNTCLCPEGFYSDRGICKEFQWNCKTTDCKPGKCVSELGQEKCLCPEGYTSKSGNCLEIAYTSSGQISSIMLMIIVAIASVMLTTFLGVCICYYTHQSRQ